MMTQQEFQEAHAEIAAMLGAHETLLLAQAEFERAKAKVEQRLYALREAGRKAESSTNA